MTPDFDSDAILIEKLEIAARVGTTAEERAWPQPLTITLSLWPKGGFSGVGDQIERTVDYAAVCEVVRGVTATRSRHLIETLAEEVAAALMDQFPLAALELELRKYILPGTEYVGVRIRRKE